MPNKMNIRNYGKMEDILPVSNLMHLQIDAYKKFLQLDMPPSLRKPVGIEGILQETFPIENYDGTMSLEYVKFDLGAPRFSPDQCNELKVTYGMPFRIWVRLVKEGVPNSMEEVYLGEIPKMIGGGEFIINGAARVIVNQLHRSPGIDFGEETPKAEKKLFKCRIIPERGSWIEFITTKKDVLQIRIDQSTKSSAICFLRAMDPKYSTNDAIIREFYPTEKVELKSEKDLPKIIDKHTVLEVREKETEDLLLNSGDKITEELAEILFDKGFRYFEIISEVQDPLILNSLATDTSTSHENAIMKIYVRLRPGNPAVLEKAKELFYDKFFNDSKYRLGGIGRFRINRKFGENVKEDVTVLQIGDVINSINYILKLRNGQGEMDDIDHLGNRRVKTIGELVGDELRKGFLKLKRTIRERMGLMDPGNVNSKSLINAKTISSTIEYFFARGELSQVVDQTNPLAQLTHERTLSALGPGGLNRKRAGFEVRDVHISHYGRICPIETPEGANIGLISRLGIYASLDKYGFLTTPYAIVKNGKITKETCYLRADEEDHCVLCPSDVIIKKGKLEEGVIVARVNGEVKKIHSSKVDYLDISPKQLVGVSASLIPFLEHDDANRALMGSNMQRQAVPLVKCEYPVVMTGMEKEVAKNSGMVVVAEEDGVVSYVDARKIVMSGKTYKLRKFAGLNDRTCLNQKPIVVEGQKVKKGEVIADGAATKDGILALGKNVLVGFMLWEGYNFEDAIIVSEKLVKDDTYTSIHIDSFEIKIRETKLGREEFTREIPNVSERLLQSLDEDGIIRVGTRVRPGDILVGKVIPKSKTELTPEEKLLHAIFGKAGADVKNDSMEVPSGVEGIVIGTKKFSRKALASEEDQNHSNLAQDITHRYECQIKESLQLLFENLEKSIGGSVILKATKKALTPEFFHISEEEETIDVRKLKELMDPTLFVLKNKKLLSIYKIIREHVSTIEELEATQQRELKRLHSGDELTAGVLELVRVYIATKRVLSVGDKMAGRHGNKGVISRIVPEEDMPFLADGTPLEILLNPLGVPSRMNVGQILETHLGWAARKLDFTAVTPVFSGAREEEIRDALREANLPESGKIDLYDGRTGEAFLDEVTVGYIYMLKLHHLVDDKVHARATGPYSLITQQPLGGKARFGGQRFGEMEVWALEAYGASNILQELLTVKSDDVDGRTKIYESMVKGENTLEPGTPVSFDVLTNEIKGLSLNLTLHKRRSI